MIKIKFKCILHYFIFLLSQYLDIILILDNMAELQERVRILQNDLQEALEEIKKKEKQIQSIKKTNKIAEAHSETLRKKILELEKRSSTILVGDDSSKVQQMKTEIERYKLSIANLQQENKHLSRLSEEQKVKISEYEEQLAERQMQHLQFKRSKSENTREAQKMAEYQKKLKAMEKELLKANITISEMNSTMLAQKRQANNYKSSQPYLTQSISYPNNRVQFFQAVPLSQSLNQNHFEIPTTHKKLFKLLDLYYQRLMPNEKVKFLNLICADAENKLQSINDQMELLANMDDE